MWFKIKTSFVLSVVVMLLSGAVTSPVAVGQDSSADKVAAEKAAAEKAAAEKAEAEKAAEKAKLEKNPLVVNGVEPFVALGNKGKINEPDQQNLLGKAGMGDRISVVIPGLSRAATYKLIDPAKLVLFIDGAVYKEVFPDSVGGDSLVFKLKRTTSALDAWNALLGSPSLDSEKPVVVSVGYPDQQPWKVKNDKPNLNLIVYRKPWAVISVIGLVLMLLLFLKYGTKDLLRDSVPPNPAEGKLRPYSLAKVQVAWWFFLVIGCFLLIYLITGEFTMTEQALILVGIGTGTALGSAMIDASKRNSANSELDTLKPQQARLKAEAEVLTNDIRDLDEAIKANPGVTDADKASLIANQESLKAKEIELAEKDEKLNSLNMQIAAGEASLTEPTSVGFWDDLVTDADGVSFHRFQMIVWTVILGILFLAGVYKNLAMPEFSGTMLALMGISAGTYLGFKVPERQSTPKPDEEKPDAQGKADAQAKAKAGG